MTGLFGSSQNDHSKQIFNTNQLKFGFCGLFISKYSSIRKGEFTLLFPTLPSENLSSREFANQFPFCCW